ncbi:hypothetical protein KTO58_06680 [Chitinophaga pendula]|nr:hypothetical protein KTO58_06680 [Chitinophaga pendula]
MMKIARQALYEVIKEVIAQEIDCQAIHVYEDHDNLQRLLIIEKWTSKGIFLGSHMQMPYMKAFMQAAESFLDGKADFTCWDEVLVAP